MGGNTETEGNGSQRNDRRGIENLLHLPWGILADLWPAERIVIGLRVCKHMRSDFAPQVGTVVLARSSACLEFEREDIWKTLMMFPGGRISLIWRRGKAELLLQTLFVPPLSSLPLFSSHTSNALDPRTNLTTIDLCGAGGVQDEGVLTLTEFLRECTNLTTLNLSQCRISSRGAGTLAAVLPDCPSLSSLDLSKNRIIANGAGFLANVLGRCHALRHLDLGWNTLRPEGVLMLARALVDCKALSTLKLPVTSIQAAGGGGECAKALGNAITRCKTLTDVDLSRNPIGQEVLNDLAHGMEHNASLLRLDLSWLQISGVVGGGGGGGAEAQEDRHPALAQLLDKCSALTYLNVQGNAISHTAVERLQQAAPSVTIQLWAGSG